MNPRLENSASPYLRAHAGNRVAWYPWGDAALAQPLAYGALLRVAADLARPPRQLVVVSDDPTARLCAAARRVPADVLAIVTPAQAEGWSGAVFELFTAKTAVNGRPTAYDCRDFAYLLPMTDPAHLVA